MNQTETDAIAEMLKSCFDEIMEIETFFNVKEKETNALLKMVIKFADQFEKEDKERAKYGSTPTLGESMEFDRQRFLKKVGVQE